MSRLQLFFTLVAGLGLASCIEREPAQVVFETLEWRKDVYHLNGAPFTGIARSTHADGSPKGEYPLLDGQFHGVVREWWENGAQSVETHFDKGQRHGSNRYWSMDGRLTKEQIYDHDRSVRETHFPLEEESEGKGSGSE